MLKKIFNAIRSIDYRSEGVCFSELGRVVHEAINPPPTREELMARINSWLDGRGEELTNYQGALQGWAVSDELLAEARKDLGDWVLRFLWLEDKVHVVSLKWEVCGTCDGRGKVVNPSIDAHGITADEFYDDPDFAEDYHRGVYDIPCPECHGRTTSLGIDLKNTEAETLKYIEKWFRDEASYRAEVAAERRMGC